MPIKLVKLWEADAVTEEILEIVWSITEDRYQDEPIDWERIWSLLYNEELEDGSYLDLDGCEGSPALIKIKQEILRLRREQ